MKYFVTGATGFIGGAVARQLVEAGHEVNAVVRTPAKADNLIRMGVTVFQGDITDKESMREAMTGVDGVFHIAAWYKVGVIDPNAENINVTGTRNVLELMRELKIPKGVYTSTVGVFSDTRGRVLDETHYHDYSAGFGNEYERTKWLAHYRVALPMIKAGLPLVIVMPGLVYGPDDTSAVRDSLIMYLKRKMPMVPQQTAFVWGYIDDIARGHILAMEKGTVGESYIVAGDPHTLVDVFQVAEQITGIPGPRIKLAPAALKAIAGVMALIGRVVNLPENYRAEVLRTMAGRTHLGDTSKAKRELGYNPRPLAEGLRQTLEHEMQLMGTRPAAVPIAADSATK